ncbi:MAG: DUF1924 domain-containing protein [Gammaproteobacteria bacterium]|nr:DUF1924 domain-containing protein [Gammaproteobacteria bacterium]
MKLINATIWLLAISATPALAATNAADQLISSYPADTPAADAGKGQALWNQKFPGKAPFGERSCQMCHNSNLKQPGEHIRTRKLIKPLAPSVNPQSLSDIKKISKWLKRNCKWTIGRECSAEEKTHLLSFIKQQ